MNNYPWGSNEYTTVNDKAADVREVIKDVEPSTSLNDCIVIMCKGQNDEAIEDTRGRKGQ